MCNIVGWIAKLSCRYQLKRRLWTQGEVLGCDEGTTFIKMCGIFILKTTSQHSIKVKTHMTTRPFATLPVQQHPALLDSVLVLNGLVTCELFTTSSCYLYGILSDLWLAFAFQHLLFRVYLRSLHHLLSGFHLFEQGNNVLVCTYQFEVVRKWLHLNQYVPNTSRHKRTCSFCSNHLCVT